MGRIARGFRLAGASWRVLKADRELMVLPLISGILTLTVAFTFFYGLWGTEVPTEGFEVTTTHYVALGLFYLVANWITIFFNAAVVGAAMIRLDGGDPTIGDGLRVARAHAGRIFAWALLTATVGLIIRVLEERFGWLGRLILGFVGAAWSAITFFVVPVLLFEDGSVGESVKRSGALFKQRWGEQFTGTVSIGLAMALLFIPVAMIGGAIMQASVALGMLALVTGFTILFSAGGAMNGIFNAVLYRYATRGSVPAPFTTEDLAGSFSPRRR